MLRNALAATAIAVMAGTAFAADYNFPSHATPGSLPIDEVKQYVSFVWDDNAYSGKTGTNYEGEAWIAKKSGGQTPEFKDQSWVGGKRVEGDWSTTGLNDMQINEGDMGMSWAAYTLAGHKAEPAMYWSSKASYSQGAICRDDKFVYEASGYINAGTKLEALDTTTIPNWSELAQWEKDQHIRNFPWKKIREIGTEAPSKLNPDGSPITFTFNVISGFFVPTWPTNWQARESKYGYYVPNDEFYEDGYNMANRHSKVAVSWGREMPIYSAGPADADKNQMNEKDLFVQGYINHSFREATQLGHELGNHTIDHMESNSPLPNKKGEPIASMPGAKGMAYRDGFALWGSDGYDTDKLDELPWGETGNEATEFGQKDGNIWQWMGWKMYAGKYISKEAWAGAIKLAEDELDLAMDMSVSKGNLFGFRAPRLEVNSEMFFALSDLGYKYDTGLEDGLDETKDGTNFVWPYTVDNGAPNIFTMKRNGYKNVMIDEMPVGKGLWQYPVNNVIVPEEDRDAVFSAYQGIQAAQGIDVSADKAHWVANSGKVTGFDFNMFILWGMTGPQAEKALKHTLDLRMKGNKAPFQVGAHTDYFTPIYDHATLQNDHNKNTFGLCLKYNTWTDRKDAFTNFVDYALSKGAYIKSANETIEYVKELQKTEKVGTDVVNINPSEWTLMSDGVSTGTESVSDLQNASVNVGMGWGAWGGYYGNIADASGFKGLSHIELEYNTEAPLYLTLLFEGDERRDVLLNNLKYDVKSGKIPFKAFANLATGESSMIDPTKIIGIAVYPQKLGEAAETLNFSVKNIKFYTGAPVAIGSKGSAVAKNAISVSNITSSNLDLTVSKAGDYSINLYGFNGRLLKSISNVSMSAGVNPVDLGSVPAGMYVLKVQGAAGELVSKAMIR